MEHNKQKVFIIGLGHIGLPMLICLSKVNKFNLSGVEKIIVMAQKN